MRYIIILITIAFISCNSSGSHNHVHELAIDPLQTVVDIPRTDYTFWTDNIELFVEFPVLIAGETSKFAAHFTELNRHQAIQQGSVSVRLINDVAEYQNSVDTSSSPGIFTPSLRPEKGGIFQLEFELKTKSLSENIIIDTIRVYNSAEEAMKNPGGESETSEISFLKEQAWKMDFQTDLVQEDQIYNVIQTSGVWKVAPSDYTNLVSTTSGRILYNKQNITHGTKVRKGDVLLTVSSAGLTSDNLSAEITKAEADYEQAKLEYERKQKLYESQVVPKSELERAFQKYQIAKSNYETLSEGYISGGKQVFAPFDGYVKNIEVTNGDYVEQGSALLTIASNKSSMLEAYVSPDYSGELKRIQNLWYQPAKDRWSSLKATGGSILSITNQVTIDHPLLSVFATVNDNVEVPEGSFTDVQITYGEPHSLPVVPSSALLEEYGNYSVIVQISGETFERRSVSTGRRNGSHVEITEGLEAGERIVTKGAYQVKMASLSGQTPDHGHAH